MKNKVISLFLAAAMVLSLCPASVRAQTVSEEFSAKVAEAAETETVEGTADPTEEPVVTGNTDTAETDTPQATEAPEETEVVGTGKDEKYLFRRQQKKKQKPPGIPGRKTKN
ncbi:MAG: hypothetical protein ACLVAT_12525 [Lachnospiraceae bacterium]